MKMFSILAEYTWILLILALAGCQSANNVRSEYDLVFCADHAVYDRSSGNSTGTEIHKIIDLPEDATCPVWSPDGKLALLYRYSRTGLIVNDSLSLIDRQTGTIREVYHFGPRDADWTITWKPGGISLLVSSARNYHAPTPCDGVAERTVNGIDCWSSIADLYLADVSFQNSLEHFERITTSPSARCGFKWSTDNMKLAFMQGAACTESGGSGNALALNLETVSFVQMRENNLSENNATAIKQEHPAAWSPDGKSLLVSKFQFDGYTQTQQMLIIDNTGSVVQKLLPDNRVPVYWIPDGAKIIWAGESLGVTDISDNHAQELMEPGLQYSISRNSISPDSKFFTWSVRRDAPNSGELRIADLSSGQESTVTSLLAHSWSWSPDGKSLALSARTPLDNNACKYQIDIYTIRPDGTGLLNLTEGRHMQSLQCGPQGVRLSWYMEMVEDVQWIPLLQ